MNSDQAFWDQVFVSLAIIVGVTLPLLVVGVIVEVISPGTRKWVRRLRRIEAGRQAQRSGK